MLVPLPPLPEQHKIAEILSTVDETTEKTNAIIHETQQLKKGLMQKLFTEGIGHTRFRETNIGRIPEEWEVGKVEEVCHKKINKFEPRESNKIYPYIGLEHIEAHSHILNGYGKSNETLSTKNMFVTNDILYGKLRPYLNKVWKAEFDGVCTTEILVILANDRIEQDYLYYLLQQKRFVEYANSMTEGTSLPRVNWDDIQKYKIALPPKEEQFRIIKILTEVDTKIETEQAHKIEMEQLKKGLMQVLLTGEVRVDV